MDLVKRKVLPGMPDVYIERMRGYVVLEGKEEEQVYEMVCNFNEISMRPLKGVTLKPEDLGFVFYGRNLSGP